MTPPCGRSDRIAPLREPAAAADGESGRCGETEADEDHVDGESFL